MVDLTKIKASETKMPERQGPKPKKDRGPNVFLDPDWPGNLQQSYDEGKAFSLTVAGKYVEGKIETGRGAGRKVLRLTGDAVDVIALIREASNNLNMGVSITPQLMVDATPEAAKKIQKSIPRPGQVTVTWQGKDRKVPTADIFDWARETGRTFDDTKPVPSALRRAYDKAHRAE